MSAYYNEYDSYAAAWLRNLIAAGHLPAGDVDERSIVDVKASDLKGFTQCHFFAGIGGWSVALRLAGWPDDRPVWTGSCPCQPLSSAGAHKGHADERHLWPAFYGLIAQRRPPKVLGEQVASKDGREWLAGVRADLEDARYAVGAADLCAASAGAPHIRQRLWWVAESQGEQRDRSGAARYWRSESSDGRADGRLADAHGGHAGTEGLQRSGQHGQQPSDGCSGGLGHAAAGRQRIDGRASGCGGHADIAGASGPPSGVALGDTFGARLEGQPRHGDDGHQPGRLDPIAPRSVATPGHARFWDDAIGLVCTDGKTRRIEPGSFPLAHGVSNRMGRLRAYGNAIVPQVAAEFIMATMDL